MLVCPFPSFLLQNLDQKLTLHYFGRMHFIHNLLPLLRRTATEGGCEENKEDGNGSVRVLSVLSGGVHSPFKDFRYIY